MPDLRPAQWSKLIFNASVNTVAALTGLPHDHHFAAEGNDADLGHLLRGLVDEGKRIAAAAGVELHDDPWEMNVLATKRGSAHFPPMLEDVQARRPTEIDLITGALVREADGSGFPSGSSSGLPSASTGCPAALTGRPRSSTACPSLARSGKPCASMRGSPVGCGQEPVV